MLTGMIVAVAALLVAVAAWLRLSPSDAPKAGVGPSAISSLAPRIGHSGGPASRLSGDLARLAAASPRRRVEVIIQLRSGVTVVRGRALVRSVGGQPGVDLHIINGLSAQLPAPAESAFKIPPERYTRTVTTRSYWM